MSFTYKYPHPAVTTDCVILTFHEDRLKLLLIRRGVEPYKGQWALPGGFIKMNESAEECARRELREETGVTGCKIKQFHTFSAPSRDPRERVITIAFYALMKWQKATGADDAEFADWIPLNQLPPLAFDHADIIRHAIEAIKRDIFFEPVGFELLNDVFSMPELQKVYEAILGREFDRRNFAKKMKHLDILEEVTSSPAEPRQYSAIPDVIPDATPAKSYPLPFLNSEFTPMEAAPPTPQAMNYEESFIHSSSDIHRSIKRDAAIDFEDVPKLKPRRKGLLFRLNKLKYKNLKDKNELEF